MPLVDLTRAGTIVTAEFNRPEKHNALSPELIEALHLALDELEQDRDMRVLILGGRGKSFCAGMDLRGVLEDVDAMGGMLSGLGRATWRLRQLSVPVIARIQGAAIGGGCGFAAVADLAITHPEAKLGYPEVGLGVCPAVVAPWLVRKIGTGPARAMLLQGGTMDGVAALNNGLIDRLVERSELERLTMDLAETLASGGRHAMAATKAWLNELEGPVPLELLERGAILSTEVIAGDEAQTRLKKLFSR
ncbi:MAG: enoyl-CoA hydratase/isomerase family protein [Phycisphaerales bacterium]|jgi:methylglutaconyl-CoA hydratase|nr:enoyl-CoA hydratase/isomerase family protein [Phycisphaerales bacterium]MDP6890184.1 enoyl-CoA hydratase/isomerase family protein [Phycisphaerales bacterium]